MAPDRVVAEGPRRGRPRSEASRKAILRAAGELLLEHGLQTISMDAVAERAGASKATIYRWWPSKELLALDALFSDWAPAAGAGYDTGSLAGDLQATLGMVRRIDHEVAETVCERHEVAFGIDNGLLHPGGTLFQQPSQQMRFAGAGITLHQQARS